MNPIKSLFAAMANGTAIGRREPPQVIHLPDANAPAQEARWGNGRWDEAKPAPIGKRTMRKRIAVLLAAIAVPAMAAPGDFGALPGSAPTEAELVSARLAQQLAENPAMPFERPGMSFPGSAFFFLADPPSDEALVALPTFDATDTGAESGRELGQLIDAGPAARPFFSGTGINHTRAQDCLAQAIWYEAASESEAGQRAVAQVVLNRVSHSSWPGSVCGVVYQGSNRSTGCQFSFTCDGSLARRAGGATWARAQRIASEALAGSVYQPIGHATHYHTLWVNPYWASSLDHVGTIGAHRFYRTRGAAGDASAFGRSYAGFEPGVSGRSTAAPIDSVSDFTMPALPDAQSAPARAAPFGQRGGNANRSAAPSANPVPAPVLADPALTGAGQVREDYARAGQWRSDEARAAMEAEERAMAEERAQAAPAPPPPAPQP
ncbi:cell wall hydrolase [uncultured Erythrobacter sp.]|uniref:cell wall hydrolase n=1 Tax=uncultured Erythrobacter sp. TaxID=263913 RepID=UPI00262FF8E5|nr:cell wall hydrolase [uncultured Erythrobacter sp.]